MYICPLLNHHHENQNNNGNKIDDKVTIDTPPNPDAPNADIPNNFAQDVGSKNSYLPYSLINCNQYCKNVPNTKKNMTTNTYAPDAYAPNDTKYDATDAPDAIDYDSDQY